MTTRLIIKKAAVLGAGVMGAQIAAQLINANIETILFDLPTDTDKSAIAKKAIANLKKLKPNPLALDNSADLLQPANYETDLEKLKHCDLIIEAVAERLDIKEKLYKTISPYLNEHAILASNTSGLSINHLVEVLPEQLRSRFLGVHFFNPPRYMHLVELIPATTTDKNILPKLETFLVSTLGKGVVYAKDTPNFIANRVGVFSMLATMHHAVAFNIPFEIVDALTGPAIGRAKSATFRTADVVGLDTMAHVIKTMQDNLQNDPWFAYYQTPAWLQQLINAGALGQKTGAGIYKKTANGIEVIDIAQGNYRVADKEADKEVLAILKIKDPIEKFKQLRMHSSDQAQFLWASFRDLFHYSAYHLSDIAHSVRDVDLAIRFGFGWQVGPFETWQLSGMQVISDWILEDLQAGKTMAKVELPSWMNSSSQVFYSEKGAYSPAENNYIVRSNLPVYQKQLFPQLVLGERYAQREILLENNAMSLWTQGDGVGVISFKTKMNTVNSEVLEGVLEALDYAEKHLQGVVIWQNQGNDFSAGANLLELVTSVESGLDIARNTINLFHKVAMRLRYSLIPTVAAMRGRALGGGCELPLHCDRIVAAQEMYTGLVEIGVGLLPAGGGTKEMARRAALETKGTDVLPALQNYFKQIAIAEVSSSAQDARAKNYLKSSDVIVMHQDEILYVAKQQVLAMAAANYRPQLPSLFRVAGDEGLATIKMMLVNMQEGGFISEYDFYLASKIAYVMCGGDVAPGSLVDEAWLMRLELETFLEFLVQDKTKARIKYILETGKPLRN